MHIFEGIPLPDDLLMDQVLPLLDWACIGRLGQCCKKLSALTVDNKLWQRLAYSVLAVLLLFFC